MIPNYYGQFHDSNPWRLFSSLHVGPFQLKLSIVWNHQGKYQEWNSEGHEIFLMGGSMQYRANLCFCLPKWEKYYQSSIQMYSICSLYHHEDFGYFFAIKLVSLCDIKGGCVKFDMCIFHSKLIDLDTKDTFCTILAQVYFLFSLLGQNKYVKLGMRLRLLWKYKRKSKLVYRK